MIINSFKSYSANSYILCSCQRLDTEASGGGHKEKVHCRTSPRSPVDTERGQLQGTESSEGDHHEPGEKLRRQEKEQVR